MKKLHDFQVVDKGKDHLGYYEETRCTDMGEQIEGDYRFRTIGAFWDEKMEKPRIWIRYYLEKEQNE